MKTSTVILGAIITGLILAGFSWLYAQNRMVVQQLNETRQLIQQQSVRSVAAPLVSQPDDNTLIRLSQIENSLVKIGNHLTAQHKQQSNHSHSDDQKSSVEQADSSKDNPDSISLLGNNSAQQSVRFSDPNVEPTRVNTETTVPLTVRVYQKLYGQIASEGVSPETVQLVSDGLEQLNLSNQDVMQGLQFDLPVCSEFRCAVKADTSQSKFSKSQLLNDPDYQAQDAYYAFEKAMTKKINESMARDIQVSISRSGDEIVLNISPKRQSR